VEGTTASKKRGREVIGGGGGRRDRSKGVNYELVVHFNTFVLYLSRAFVCT
jgi:hypothetical protein